jgi:hypothetical protein
VLGCRAAAGVIVPPVAGPAWLVGPVRRMWLSAASAPAGFLKFPSRCEAVR